MKKKPPSIKRNALGDDIPDIGRKRQRIVPFEQQWYRTKETKLENFDPNLKDLINHLKTQIHAVSKSEKKLTGEWNKLNESLHLAEKYRNEGYSEPAYFEFFKLGALYFRLTLPPEAELTEMLDGYFENIRQSHGRVLQQRIKECYYDIIKIITERLLAADLSNELRTSELTDKVKNEFIDLMQHFKKINSEKTDTLKSISDLENAMPEAKTQLKVHVKRAARELGIDYISKQGRSKRSSK